MDNHAHRATRAVVQIQVHGFDDESPQAVLDPRYLSTRSWGGSGSLIQVNGTEGLILTNTHVVRNAIHLQVFTLLTSARPFSAQLVGMVIRQEPDIALIKIMDEELPLFRQMCGGCIPHIELGDSDSVQRGIQIKAIGYPCGMAEPNVSGGEITNFLSGDENTSERLVTDAAINPGNSGGPAVDEKGITIGINTSIIVNADNIGFITPINYAKQLLPQLINVGEARLAHPGAMFQPNCDTTATHLGSPTAEGLIITRIFKNSMLEKAGLQRLDVVTRLNNYAFDRYGIVIDGQRPDRRRNIFDVFRSIPVGKSVTLEYVRDGEIKEVEIEATSAPSFGIDSQPLVHKRRFVELQGMIIQRLCLEVGQALITQLGPECLSDIGDRYSQDPRLIVTFLVPGSPSNEIFFMPSTIITQANGKQVYDLDDFVETIKGTCAGTGGKLVLESFQGQLGVLNLSERDLSMLRVQYALDPV